MTIAMLVEFPGMTEEQYRTAMLELQRSGAPGGELFHVAGPTEGGWRIVEGWESQEAADAFYGSAQFRQLITTMTPPIITPWPIAYQERWVALGERHRSNHARQASETHEVP